jgi:predicted O-methyltransferase YrrM
MSNRTLNLTDNLYNYLLSVSLREPEILTALRHETSRQIGAMMQISPEQGQFMALLIELLNARKTIDLGVYTGYSSLVVALALPEDGQIIACDINETSTAIAQTYWRKANVSHKIELRIAPAIETLNQLIIDKQTDSFDFIFIDADKENYNVYYEKSFVLLRSGGLMLIDNTLWHGAVADPSINDNGTQAIRELNIRIHSDARVSISMLPIGDGLTLVHKR